MGANDNFLTASAPLPIASVPEAYQPLALQNIQQQRMAQLLMQQGQQPMPQGQMISGHYVKASPYQNLASIANQALGMYAGYQADKSQLELAKKIREGQSAAMADYMGELRGRPAVEGGIYNPQGEITRETTADMYGADMALNPQYKQVASVAGRAPDPLRANLNASMNDMLPAFMREHAMKEVTKGPKWEKDVRYDDKGREIHGWTNVNDPTLPFTAQTKKPEMTASERINTTIALARAKDEGLLPANIGNLFVGGETVGSGGGAFTSGGGVVNPAASGNAPAKLPTSAKNDDVVAQFGYDPFVAPKPPPTLTTGPQIRKFYADQATSLPAETQKTVRGAINYQKAVGDLQDQFQGYKDSDLLKPSVRAELKQKVTNAYLLGKESNSLGALTGPDLSLLEKLVFDPTSFDTLILDRKTINRLYDAQRMSAGDNIRESYRIDQKPVPENLRNHIIVKPKELPMPQVDIKATLKKLNVPYDPAYEYKVNPDGTVDRRKKQ